MDLQTLLTVLPSSVKADIINIQDCKVKSTGERCYRVTLSKVLSEIDKRYLEYSKHVVHIGIAQHKYAPEIKHSYFYIVNDKRTVK